MLDGSRWPTESKGGVDVKFALRLWPVGFVEVDDPPRPIIVKLMVGVRMTDFSAHEIERRELHHGDRVFVSMSLAFLFKLHD